MAHALRQARVELLIDLETTLAVHLAHSTFDSKRAAPTNSPAYPRRRRLCPNPPLVNAVKVAPDAERRDIFVFVATTSRAKHEVMRSHVPARTDWAPAAESVTSINPEVRRRLAGFSEVFAPERGQPDVTEIFAQEPHKARRPSAYTRAHPREQTLERPPEPNRLLPYDPS